MTEQRQGPRRIEVIGVGTAVAAPDVVRLSITVRCEAADVAIALGKAAERVSAVSAAARSHGVEPRDLASTGAGVHPRHDREGQSVIGYTAFHQLQVTVRELPRMGGLIEAFATAAGNALAVDHIALDVAERAPLEMQARGAAFADAQAKAEQYAALAGSSLGEVELVSEEVRHPGILRNQPMMARAAADMPIEAGEHTVSASVSVTWRLLDAPDDHGQPGE